MTPAIPDVRRAPFGISSPRSSFEGYSCAYPSWPNRPCLDWRNNELQKEREASLSSPRSSQRRAEPTLEFLESLRRCPLPENSIIDDEEEDEEEEEEDEDNVDGQGNASAAIAAPALVSRNVSSYPVTHTADATVEIDGDSPKQIVTHQSNSLLSRAFSRLTSRIAG